jgi:class 3 adenylate cyclase
VSDTQPARERHAFVVDDEASAREMIGDYLGLQGFAVTLCEGGARCREALAEREPDIVILDLNMREEDGLSVLRFIKQTTGVPVILLTATASPIDRVVGLEMGADDYVTKPCELRELLARIRSILRRTELGRSRSEERRLAAIASFDQVGYSRSVQVDETATLAAMERVFSAVIAPTLPRHRGVLFKKLGDGGLVEFASVVDAVEWSAGFQTAVRDLPRMVAGDTPLAFRLGIAIGDIIVSGGDRLGEAVTLAVRVQEAGRPGAVTLSDYTYRLAGSRVAPRWTDLGEITLKNIAEPMRIWEWTPGS